MQFFKVQGADGQPYLIRSLGENTTCVIGRIASIETKGRPNPPKPHNAFDTDGTPFGNGHVFALSLGGSDDPKNIVPQWEQWQQTGAWRKLEVECQTNLLGKLFRCDIDYDGSRAEDRDASLAKFRQESAFIDWSDKRLPTSFHVRVYDHGLDLRGVTSGAGLASLLESLNPVKPARDFLKMPVVAMPDEDRCYWQDKALFGALEELERKLRKDTGVQSPEDDMELDAFLSDPALLFAPEARNEMSGILSTTPGFSPTEASGIQMDRVYKAVFGGGKRQKSAAQRRYEHMQEMRGRSFLLTRDNRARIAREIGKQRRTAKYAAARKRVSDK